jgi:hypothetical protein
VKPERIDAVVVSQHVSKPQIDSTVDCLAQHLCESDQNRGDVILFRTYHRFLLESPQVRPLQSGIVARPLPQRRESICR